MLAGTAVNDTSSVVAASTTYGPAATRYAVVVKLARTLMIIPICGRGSHADSPQRFRAGPVVRGGLPGRGRRGC
ncbi:MAG: putative sulfate exporter family transporter [Trebonia sp.]